MVRRKVKKVVAVCFLEATKVTIEHLGQHRLELEAHGNEGANLVATGYREVRRLRDYLQRSVGSFQDMVELDLARPDQDLLVACCLRYIETIELRPKGTESKAIDREWLQRKLEMLGEQVVEMAEQPLHELPLPRTTGGISDAAREVHKQITQKFSQPIRGRKGIGTDVTATAGSSDAVCGRPGFGQVFGSESEPATFREAEREPARPEPAVCSAPVEVEAPVQPSRGASLIDSRTMRDPRLRSLLAFDLRAFDRAVEAGDHRLAAVHLASILEAAVLDHALLRRVDLGINGPPDTWNPQDILLRVFGDECAARDRQMVQQLFASFNLVRPGSQLAAPTVVTPGSLDRLVEFTMRAMRQMGYVARSSSATRQAAAAPQFSGSVGRSV